jgi:hypothetical protein
MNIRSQVSMVFSHNGVVIISYAQSLAVVSQTTLFKKRNKQQAYVFCTPALWRVFNSLLKNYCARQSCVKNDEKMRGRVAPDSVYTALFSSFLPCPGFARYVFQQAVRNKI